MADATPVTPKSDLQKALAWVKVLKKGWVIVAIIVVTLLWNVISLTSRSSADGKSEKIDLKEMIDNANYDHPEPFTFTAKAFTEEGERVRLKGVKPGKWKFTFPDQWTLEVGNNQRYRPQAGFCILSAKGRPMPMLFSSSVMVNGKLAGKEAVEIGPDGYVTIHVFLGTATEEERKKTILLGKPIKAGVTGYICPPEPEGAVSDRIQLQG